MNMIEEEGKRPAYVYCRYSSEMQSQGDSLRRQFQRSNEAIKKYNLFVKERITDEAFSGFHGDNLINGKLKDFIDRAISGDIEKNAFLIVENIDRITRLQPSKAVKVISSILSSGIEIYQTSPECLFTFKNKNDEAMTLIMLTLFSQRAHEESDTKSYRVKEAWLSRIDRILKGEQKILLNKAPYWLDIVEKEFDVNGQNKLLKCYEINKKNADEVRSIFDTLKYMGFKETCKKINETSGKKWTVKGLQRLLACKTLYGEMELNLSVREDGKKELQSRGIEMPKIYPPIMTRQEYDEVLTLIKCRGAGRGTGRKSTKLHNLFSRIIYCAHCGGAYRYMHKDSNYNYLVCYNSEVNMCKHNKVLSLRYYEVENAIFKLAGYFDINRLYKASGNAGIEYSGQIQSKKEELKLKREAFTNMFNSIMQKNNGVISSIYQSSLDMTEKDISVLEREIEALEQKLILNPARISFKGAVIMNEELLRTPEGRLKLNAHLKRIVERIDVENNKFTGDGYNTLRIKFVDIEEILVIKFMKDKNIYDGMVYESSYIYDMDAPDTSTEEEWDAINDELNKIFE